MTHTMRRTITNLTMGLALLLATGGTLYAQVNPATVRSQAQNGANQAQQTNSATQAQVQGQTQTKKPVQTPPKTQAQNQTQNSRQGTATQSNPPSKPPVTTTAKPPVTTTAKPPVTQGTKPPATKPPATSAQQPPKTPATNGTATQKQKTPAVSVTPAPKTAPKTTPKTAQANHTATQTPPNTTAKAPAKKPVQTTPTTTRTTPPPARRDPFVTLVGKHQGGDAENVHLPPGKAGLQVHTLVIQGILSSPSGMIAVVANPQRSVYFLHAGDELFDGRVERIDIDAVTFHEVGKDAFGKPLERQVTRKLNPSLGEQP